MKRLLDILLSIMALLLLLPLFILMGAWIALESRGGMFYSQMRVGKGERLFRIYKFRSMSVGSDQKGLLTVGGHDPRITKSGYFIRKYKLDELPQLLNILLGDMSLVGPRPEVKKYVDLYDCRQRKVLEIRPGLTDYASLEYFNENELLSHSPNPEQTYILEIMPAKLELNLRYMEDQSLSKDIKILWETFIKIIT